MADTTDDQAIPHLYDDAQAAIAKLQAENAMFRARHNMPKSTLDCVLPLRRLYEAACTQFARDAAEKAAMRNAFEARLQEITDAHTKMQNLVLRFAGSVNMPKYQSSQMLQRGDYDALADYLEIRIDQTVAAQNGRNLRGDGHHRVWLRKEYLDEYIQNDKLLHALTLLKPARCSSISCTRWRNT